MSAQVITEAETALGHLERLTDVLRAGGWSVEVAAPADRRPTALVVNPSMRALQENVIAVRETSGSDWSYCYGWGERIAPCTDPSGAASTLGRVLAAHRDN
ncbi:hypothetical protein E1293_08535 [Actinomadura darangshiensis]|uniref:Uncharacterized protein n=1 Tax=Actinomadura darangshiensis TaxID=705336 RepID=A0A4R5BJQ3_9ACTN|nr:hypothetical protein [Actinomadura darangshiensis]TDD86988.1 hypothetical protein E1293_08535 [Actinomadura darangshiensis]